MANVQVRTLSTRMDAWQRAVRTFLGGLVTVALTAAGAALAAAITPGIRWTREYWTAVGALVVAAVINAVVSYVIRFTHPPANRVG